MRGTGWRPYERLSASKNGARVDRVKGERSGLEVRAMLSDCRAFWSGSDMGSGGACAGIRIRVIIDSMRWVRSHAQVEKNGGNDGGPLLGMKIATITTA